MKHVFIVCLSLFVITGCKKKDSTTNGCEKPGFSVTGSTGYAAIYVTGNGSYGFYQIQYGPSGFALGSGNSETINGNTQVTLTDGTYDFYIRGNCGGTTYSDWSGPKSCLVTGNPAAACNAPSNLVVNPGNCPKFELAWSAPGTVDYYVVEYGTSGFSHGSGTFDTVNSNYDDNGKFAKNTTYDFYVKAHCNGGWSNWSEVKSFYADKNCQLNLAPINITGANGVGSTVDFSWDANGECTFETYISTFNTGPTSTSAVDPAQYATQTYSLSSGTTYFLWVRAIWHNGARSAWTGPYQWN